MISTEIQAAYQRATEVLNGFRQPSERNARDVVALIKYIHGLKEPEQRDDPDFQAVKDMFGL